MKVGVISDVHCNFASLQHALQRMADVDHILCLGDAISDHRFSNEVVGLLKARGASCIKGNHEDSFLGAGGARARSAPGIDADLCSWLAGWPREAHISLGRSRIWMVHAAPWRSSDYARIDDPRFAAALASSDADILLCGHTHQPAIRKIEGKLLVNPGSIGEGRPTEQGFIRSVAIVDTERVEATILDCV